MKKEKEVSGVKVFIGLFLVIALIIGLGLLNFSNEKAEQREAIRVMNICIERCGEIGDNYAYGQMSMFSDIYLRMTGEWNYYCTCVNQKGVAERIEVKFE
jgi:hypothetical protein